MRKTIGETMMTILFDGDSFCYGAELSDISKRYSDEIGRTLNHNIINLATVGSSNQKIISRSYDYIQQNPVHLCVIGLTFLERFSLPFNSKILNWNGNLAHSVNSKERHLLAKYIYSTNKDFSIWYKYHLPFIQMFNDACKLRNIPVIYHANNSSIRKSFIDSGIDVLPVSFIELTKEYSLVGLHPSQEAHQKYAEYLSPFIIKKLENL